MAKRPKTKHVEPAEERAIVAELKKPNMSQYAVAKKFGRSRQTIHRIANKHGLATPDPKTQAATAANQTYAKARRIELVDKALEKAERILERIEAPGHLQQWAMALAVLLDKRRQEDDDTEQRRGSISALMERLREGEDDAGTPEG